MCRTYVLDAHGVTFPAPDFASWLLWFSRADHRIASTRVAELHVSTVFLGMDQRFGVGPPLLFETMVFSDDGEARLEHQYRYSSHEDAIAGHARVVDLIQKEFQCGGLKFDSGCDQVMNSLRE